MKLQYLLASPLASYFSGKYRQSVLFAGDASLQLESGAATGAQFQLNRAIALHLYRWQRLDLGKIPQTRRK
jgi:hypothetical protein